MIRLALHTNIANGMKRASQNVSSVMDTIEDKGLLRSDVTSNP